MNKYLDYTGLTTLVNKIKELIPTVFSGSGTNHSSGLVPDPGATEGTTKYLREDGTWAVPEGSGGNSVQSDWNQSDNTANDYIKNKPTIPDTTNFIEKSQTTGLLKNDGTVDTNTYLTSAPVTSVNGSTGAVTLTIPDVSGKEDKMTVVTRSSGTSLYAAVGNYYRYTNNVGTLTITLPTPTGSKAQSILFFMTTGTSPNVTFTSSGNTIYKNDGFAIDASTKYEINALWNGSAWVINAVKYTT